MAPSETVAGGLPALEGLVTRFVSDGSIKDEAGARRRIVLGFPMWLVFQELPPDRLLFEVSQAFDLPLMPVGSHGLELDYAACMAYGPDKLQEKRWLPLSNGAIAVADPFRGLPRVDFPGRRPVLAPYGAIDGELARVFPGIASEARQRRRLGRYLLEAEAVTEEGLAEALTEQGRNGGRLGDILISHNLVNPSRLANVLATRAGLTSVSKGATSVPLLPREVAHQQRAVAFETAEDASSVHLVGPVKVALTDPTDEKIALLTSLLGRQIEPHVTDEETLDGLLAAVYAQRDVEAVIEDLQRRMPELSALRTGMSEDQSRIVIVFLVIFALGFVLSTHYTAIIIVGCSTTFYVLYTLYRLYSAWRGWTVNATINPSPEELAAMDGRELPTYTILLPVFREKPQTLRTLFTALARMDYPKHKLNGLLLVEFDDIQTQEAIEALAEQTRANPVRPAWLKTLLIPAGGPRTKPKAMIYGLLYSTGELLTIFDAEDKPEPDQLKKAAWAFARAADNVACIQAKLSYYNSRQNLLTRWFTLEYAAWFDLFLPGLHSMRAPIPLGGTSNHFRLSILKQVLAWDPYNVTEDADLGLRFTRAGYRTEMLESTTFEEANSNYKNWLRQRSRWIKGYMQTFLVHTRDPLLLYHELGFVNTVHFLATVGGLCYTVLISPLFWSLLGIWLLWAPGWIPALFPGPIYYMAMASLIFGNFFFVFLALMGAVSRGQDDLSPYTLIFPLYWMMMSVAAYIALYELIRKPHYWQKTEHGLHLIDGAEPDADVVVRPTAVSPTSADEEKAA